MLCNWLWVSTDSALVGINNTDGFLSSKCVSFHCRGNVRDFRDHSPSPAFLILFCFWFLMCLSSRNANKVSHYHIRAIAYEMQWRDECMKIDPHKYTTANTVTTRTWRQPHRETQITLPLSRRMRKEMATIALTRLLVLPFQDVCMICRKLSSEITEIHSIEVARPSATFPSEMEAMQGL